MQDLAEQEIATRTVYQSDQLAVRKDEVRLPDGSTATREYVVRPAAVAVIPVLDDGRLLLARQYRYSVRRHFAEIPAGKIDPGEDAEAAARRELREETGFEAEHWRHLRAFYSGVGFADQRVELFLAEGLREVGRDAQDGEFVELVRVSLDEALGWIDDSRPMDSKTLFAVLWLARERS